MNYHLQIGQTKLIHSIHCKEAQDKQLQAQTSTRQLLAALSDIVGSQVGLRMFSVVVVFCFIQSNPDKVLASVLCQSEDFIRTRNLSGLTFL